MKPGRATARSRLHKLARLCGVETTYRNYLTGRPQRVGDETLAAVLGALGVELRSVSDAGRALDRERRARRQRGLEPVVVSWDGRPTSTPLRLPASAGEGCLEVELRLETGETIRWLAKLADLPVQERERLGREGFVARRLALPPLPLGYHRLRVGVARKEFEALILSAPQEAFSPAGGERPWGLFLPLYSLRSKKDWGAGDFTDLEAFSRWMARQGGQLVGTLPLLAAFLNQPFEPSPYSPASRLFWNEFYVDVTQAPELARCAEARRILNSAEFQRELEALRAAPLVDYRRGMALKRRVLEPLAESFFSRRTPPEAFARFLKANPEAEDYACFRAVAERRHAPWPEWPARLRGGDLKSGDFDEAAGRYHLYAQWLAHSQLERFSARAARRGEGLYLDMPLGVHPLGFDVWRHQDVFALEADGGAPPDPVWTTGQNWSFAPLHPERLREQGYGYFIACLRHQLRHAAYLRVDHIMGFHRLFWIPRGAAEGEGAYVRYRAEEFYAILCLESHRQRTVIVGENLGSVPVYVNEAMDRHHIQKMFVIQYELESDLRTALKSPAAEALAGVNTHDMPPFAAWWEGEDIADRLSRGLISPAAAREEYEGRAARKNFLASFLRRRSWLTPHPNARGGSAQGRRRLGAGLSRRAMGAATVFRACARYLAAGPPRALVLNLEDCWSETAQQNIPATTTERPNWRRKARYALEEFTRNRSLAALLREVNRLRRRRGRTPRA